MQLFYHFYYFLLISCMLCNYKLKRLVCAHWIPAACNHRSQNCLSLRWCRLNFISFACIFCCYPLTGNAAAKGEIAKPSTSKRPEGRKWNQAWSSADVANLCRIQLSVFFRRVSCSVLHYGDTGWNTNVPDGGIYWSVHVSRRDQSMEYQSSLHGWASLMSYVFLYLSTNLNPTASTWQQSQKKHCHLVAPALSFQFWEAQKRLSYKMRINTQNLLKRLGSN